MDHWSMGAVVTFILSPWLSHLTFGNKEYTAAFMWLSVTLLFNQLTSGQDVLLQGMRKLKYLAKANMLGSFVGLVISAPLYYYYRIDGIVPAIIFSFFY
jgi:O-antigen/teichoic acid export membrane protein